LQLIALTGYLANYVTKEGVNSAVDTPNRDAACSEFSEVSSSERGAKESPRFYSRTSGTYAPERLRIA